MSPTVVIDPGHGGAARVGGSSPNNASGPNGLLEKDVTLDLGRRVAGLLGPRARVVLTRTADTNLSLVDRARVARDANADVFLSIHLNGFADASVDGSEAWVATHAGPASRALASAVLDRVVGVTHARNRGVQEQDFGVLLPQRLGSSTAASLLEVAFLTNPEEARRLEQESYRQALAQAIADGIAAQLGSNGSTAQSLGEPETYTPAAGVHYDAGEVDASRASGGAATSRTGCDLVLYDFTPGSSDLKPNHVSELQAFVQSFQLTSPDHPLAHVRSIRGYTDMVDTEGTNLRIRDERANAVAQWLITQGGVPSASLTNAVPQTQYQDLTNLLSDNTTHDGRSRNRAAVIEFELVPPPPVPVPPPPDVTPVTTTHWAIRPIAKVVLADVAAGGVAVFQLTNRDTHDARLLWFAGAGVGAGEEAGGVRPPEPSPSAALDDDLGTEFETNRPVTFQDFNGESGTMVTAGVGVVFIGVSAGFVTFSGLSDEVIWIGGVEVMEEGAEASALGGVWTTTPPTGHAESLATNGRVATAYALATPAQTRALSTIADLRAETDTPAFTPRRDDVADRAVALINDPTLVDQGALGLCGPAAAHRLWIKRDPEAFASYLRGLYDTGSGYFGNVSIAAGRDLKNRDYYNSAVPAMLAKAPAGSPNANEFVCPSAEWVAMSALRDASNTFLDYEGMPDDDVAVGSSPAEVAAWLRETGVYSSVVDEGNWFLTKGLAHAEGLRPGEGCDVVLLINAHIMTQAAAEGHTKSNEFILSAFPNHFVVLESQVTEPTPDEVEFDCWTWGRMYHVRLRKDVFDPNYYGAVIATI